ncbi:MAG: sporulation protein YjcZ [Bacillota bacterium]
MSGRGGFGGSWAFVLFLILILLVLGFMCFC